jgi:hypothetical protein
MTNGALEGPCSTVAPLPRESLNARNGGGRLRAEGERQGRRRQGRGVEAIACRLPDSTSTGRSWIWWVLRRVHARAASGYGATLTMRIGLQPEWLPFEVRLTRARKLHCPARAVANAVAVPVTFFQSLNVPPGARRWMT